VGIRRRRTAEGGRRKRAQLAARAQAKSSSQMGHVGLFCKIMQGYFVRAFRLYGLYDPTVLVQAQFRD
jgi:hypothetical protein